MNRRDFLKGAGVTAAAGLISATGLEALAQNVPLIPQPEGESDAVCGGVETYGNIVNLARETESFDEYFERAALELGIVNPLTFVKSYISRADGQGNTTFRNVLDEALAKKTGGDANNMAVLIQHEAPQLFIVNYQDWEDAGVYMNEVSFIGSMLTSDFTRTEIGNTANTLLDRKITPSDADLREIVRAIAEDNLIIDATEKRYLYAQHIADYFTTGRVWEADVQEFLNGTNVALYDIDPTQDISVMTANIVELAQTKPEELAKILRNILNFRKTYGETTITLPAHYVKRLDGITHAEITVIESAMGDANVLKSLLDDETIGVPAKLLAAWALKRIEQCHDEIYTEA